MGDADSRLIAVARGHVPADLVLSGGTVIDVLSGALRKADVAIAGDQIAAVREGPVEATQVVDCAGRFIAPGLVDGHIHIESSLLAPWEFARAAAQHGTTTVVADPHEIANVYGLDGVRFMAEAAADSPMDVPLTAPSCVPATHLETAGAELGPGDVAAMLAWPQVIGLGEVMSFPGVLAADEAVLAKLDAARAMPIDGHAPGLTGPDLQAYVAAGPDSDHECTTLDEAQEKLDAGMWIMIREGTAAHNLDALLPLAADPSTARRCMFVSDDLAAHELLGAGHLDRILRMAVGGGIDPVEAIRMASLNPCTRFRLDDRGAVRAGLLADLVVFEDLEGLLVVASYKRGRDVRDYAAEPPEVEAPKDTCRVGDFDAGSFAIRDAGGPVRVIGIVSGQIVTRALTIDLPSRNGQLMADVGQDVAKVAVIERHGRSGSIALGFVQGLGLRRGGLASTVAHDSHNLVVAGMDDDSMARAARAVAAVGGGMAVVAPASDPRVLPLPIAGLMSDRPIAEVVAAHRELLRSAAGLGCSHADPFAVLSFLALPVMPELKITDQGLVDVAQLRHVPLAGGLADG